MTKRQNRVMVVVAGAAAGFLSLAGAMTSVSRAAPEVEQSETNSAQGQTRSQLVHTTATVTKIDKGTRMLSIKTESGEDTTVEVPPAVKQFDKLAVGDKIDLDYYRSMTVSLAPSSSKPAMSERKGRMVDVGGGVRGREVTMTAEVVSVDPAANTVTFKGPKGNIRTVNVMSPALQAKLPSLKPGQVVQFDWVEAVAASIQPAAK